ncbi:FadR/GntR family transcriptional regulator [Sinomonas terrae]|uniref:FadR family transcriptional regulator n=1 Tax=Sinomonas terrae TaxID=2908838 RepID=A0ABS9U043_9MICC|nr:FadR/GntR family transcriptional regulator [Sinomonas terrae]MCH6470069.1 FadR family transcriptional regulator [Sinomonas terrae]
MSAAVDLNQALGSMESSSVAAEVAERLMGVFTNGQIAPGTRLPSERSLAASLGVGRSAIREALAALEILGIVIVRPGSGTYLRGGASELLPRTLSWGLMLGEPRTRELAELRSGLEVQAAEQAAARISDESIERMAGFVATMNRSTEDFEAFKEADSAFHREIALASGNTVLEAILQSIRSLLRIWMDRGLRDEERAAEAAREHSAVFEAIRSRDPEAARRVMQQHMATATGRLLSDFNPPTD